MLCSRRFQLRHHEIYLTIADTTTIMPYDLPKGPLGRNPLEKGTREAPHEETKDTPREETRE